MRETTPYRLSNLLLDASVPVLLALSGPFGTFQSLTLQERALMFSLGSMGTALCTQFIVRLCLKDPWLSHVRRPYRILVGTLLASIPSVVVVRAVGQALGLAHVMPDSLLELWFQICQINIALVALHFVLLHRLQARRRSGDHAAEPKDPDPRPETEPLEVPPPTLVARLAPENRGAVISLTAQDHYVEITTTGGAELVLMRLSDAISELQGLPGVQIHRSHWVALSAIRSTSRSAGRMNVTLVDGRSLPVATTREKSVRATLDRREST